MTILSCYFKSKYTLIKSYFTPLAVCSALKHGVPGRTHKECCRTRPARILLLKFLLEILRAGNLVPARMVIKSCRLAAEWINPEAICANCFRHFSLELKNCFASWQHCNERRGLERLHGDKNTHKKNVRGTQDHSACDSSGRTAHSNSILPGTNLMTFGFKGLMVIKSWYKLNVGTQKDV